jgi:alpha-amylase
MKYVMNSRNKKYPIPKLRILPKLVVSLLFLFVACSPLGNSISTQLPGTVVPKSEGNQSSSPRYWWNDAVFYEIFVRSFYDSNGDGIGDIPGLINKLDYLNDGDPNTISDLGVTAIWLMPIFPASSYHGYDVTDFTAVNPDYGTLEEFKNLVEEAHKRGIKIIMDFPLNHTSDQHEWFQKSAAFDSNYRDYYIWEASNPNYKGPLNETVWFPGKESGFYYGIFNAGMPDLNYKNPKVTEEIQRASEFWVKETGVDGFRLDAAQYLVEEKTRQDNTGLTHEWLENFRKFYKSLQPEIMTVGEIWNSSQQASTYVQGNELDLAFDFDLAKVMVGAAGGRIADVLNTVLGKDYPLFNNGSGMATFLTNHDMARAMNSFNKDTDKAKSAATILLTSPGTPFIYYGEEIGMTGEKPDPQIRTPMHWSDEQNAGFTTGIPWENINTEFATVNVANQIDDPESLLSHYRNLIKLRNDYSALRDGELYIVETGNRRVYAVLRENDNQTILVLINLSNGRITNLELDLAQGKLEGKYILNPILGSTEGEILMANSEGGFENFIPVKNLPANSNLIFLLQPTQ